MREKLSYTEATFRQFFLLWLEVSVWTRRTKQEGLQCSWPGARISSLAEDHSLKTWKYIGLPACFCHNFFSLFLFSPPLPLFFPLPSLRLMHLTNHWARKGINSYSKQRAIMGTLVVRKLRIFKPARRYAGITEHFYTLLSKHSIGQAWKERGGRDFRQGKAMWGEEESEGGLFPWCSGTGLLLLKQMVHKGIITKWHDDPAYSGSLTTKQRAAASNTPQVLNCVYSKHTNASFYVHSCLCYFLKHLARLNISTLLILQWLIWMNLRVLLPSDVILHKCSQQMTTKRLQCLLGSKYIACFDNSMTFSTLSSGVSKL